MTTKTIQSLTRPNWIVYDEASKKKEEIKLTKKDRVIIEVGGWLAIFSFFVGIWYDKFRFKIISSGFLLIILIVLFYFSRKEKEKELMNVERAI